MKKILALLCLGAMVALSGSVAAFPKDGTMPQFVEDTLDSITIGVPFHYRFAACTDEKVAVNVATLHVTQGYDTAKQYFALHQSIGICGLVAGNMFAYRVVYHGDVKGGIVKIVDVSGMKPDGTPNVGEHFYIITQRPINGSGIKEAVVGERGA